MATLISPESRQDGELVQLYWSALMATITLSSPACRRCIIPERVPALGWNTWCTIGNCGLDLCYEQEIRDVADAMVATGLRDAGYTHINLDGGWWRWFD